MFFLFFLCATLSVGSAKSNGTLMNCVIADLNLEADGNWRRTTSVQLYELWMDGIAWLNVSWKTVHGKMYFFLFCF